MPYKKFRFHLFGNYFSILAFHFGRPKKFYKYNDGHSAFVDLGPVRFSREYWREA